MMRPLMTRPFMTQAPSAPRRAALALLAGLALPTAGCVTDRVVPNSTVPLADYHARHPIVLADSATTLDVFPSTGQGRLDRHTAKQVYAFAEQYRDNGRGEVSVLVPRGGGIAPSTVADIRRVLALGGARGGVTVASYPVADPRLAAPVRLSYNGLKASVADQCGQWPSDLASGSSIEGWDNKPYWNLGCATQTMIAAQASDPRDLVAPRGEEPADTMLRERGIRSTRDGQDPGTVWRLTNSNIGNVGN